jgi:hypothetical protein
VHPRPRCPGKGRRASNAVPDALKVAFPGGRSLTVDLDDNEVTGNVTGNGQGIRFVNTAVAAGDDERRSVDRVGRVDHHLVANLFAGCNAS